MVESSMHHDFLPVRSQLIIIDPKNSDKHSKTVATYHRLGKDIRDLVERRKSNQQCLPFIEVRGVSESSPSLFEKGRRWRESAEWHQILRYLRLRLTTEIGRALTTTIFRAHAKHWLYFAFPDDKDCGIWQLFQNQDYKNGQGAIW